MIVRCRFILMLMSFAVVLQSSLGMEEEYPSTYLILTPATMRPGLIFTLSVQIREASDLVTVTATIKREGTDNTDNLPSAEGMFSPGQLGTLEMQIPADIIPPSTYEDQYSLEIIGSGGLTFSETKRLQFDVTHFAIFVQTDKAIYKPGQTVNYRVFAVYPGMKVYKGPFDITVTDPNDNIIQLHTGLQNDTYGVITLSMVMSSEPVLGDWEIKVSAEGQSKTQKVTIDEYVLPKFEVEVGLPPYISGEDSALNVKISSKYTYGKPVKGRAKAIIKGYYDNTSTFEAKLDGTADITISMDALLKPYGGSTQLYDGMRIMVTGEVTEELTGLKQNSSATVEYYEKPIKIEALPITSQVYKPGLTYTAFLAVTHQDGSMLTDFERRQGLLVAFSPSADYEAGDWKIDVYSIPETGVVVASYNAPHDVPSLQIKAFYYDKPSTQEISMYIPGSYHRYLTKMQSPSSSFMQIALETEKVSVGEEVSMVVTTTEVASKLSYLVLSQGDIKLNNFVTTSRLSTPITFSIDSSMAPKAKVVVSYIRSDGEVVVDSVELKVDGSFQNEVSVSFDKETTEPGDDITFTVKSSPESLVGILAVDQSVLLLKSGNDVTQEQVIEDLSAIDSGRTSDWDHGIYYRRKKRRVFWYPGFSQSSSARGILADAGLLTFTDANIYGESNYYYYDDAFDAAPGRGPVFAEAAPAADETSNKRQPSGGDTGQSQMTVRKEFPETWLWSDYVSDANGHVTVRTTVPDTITSWILSAFAVSTSDGLGISAVPAEMTVFKPFFVSLNLPYSIIRGEQLVLQANVFNYFDKDIKATVTLEKSSQYASIKTDKNGLQKTSSDGMIEKVTVPAGSGVSVYFPMDFKKLGMVDIEVRAVTDGAFDGVRRQLLVEPEGVSLSHTKNLLINEGQNTDFQEVFTIDLPPASDLVSGSVRVVLSFVGDIMGPTMNNLDSLLKMPYGCGEQNMMTFAPDVFVYEYLSTTGQSNDAIEDKALRFMLSGYQRELTYKHTDGSFSAFGKSDVSGSSWLTAFVLKSFARAQPFITIDPKILSDAIRFIIDHQERSGEFTEPGRIVDTIIQGGVNPGATLTAFITIALAESRSLLPPSKEVEELARSVDSAVLYLEEQFDSIKDDTYALCMVTYALALTGSTELSRFKAAMDEKKTAEGGQTYWTMGEEEEDDANYWYRPYHGPPSSDIEMTAYALLVYMQMDDTAGASTIVKWLTNQRNQLGGYGSTQDTVIALQALTEFAMVFTKTEQDMELMVSLSDSDFSYNTIINTDTSVILQQVELPTQSGEVIVSGSGSGTCLMTLAVFYNLQKVQNKKHFDFHISMDEIDKNNLEITACGRFIGEDKHTSMCLMDIGVPSGFAADRDYLIELVKAHPLVQKFETVAQAVYLYFEKIPKDETTCVKIHVTRSDSVANIQPKYAKLYDYYKPDRQVVVEYSSETLQNSKVCDVCPYCAGCSGGAKQPLVSLVLLVVTLIIAVFVGKV